MQDYPAIPGGEHLEACYSCGTCVSKCLIQQKVDPEYNPRRLLRLVMMDMQEEAFNWLDKQFNRLICRS